MTDRLVLATAADPITDTCRWIQQFVVGLNLCPFAKKPFDAGRIRFVSTDVTGAGDLLDVLDGELLHLTRSSRNDVETTILIHPRALTDFRDYNDFLADADRRVRALGLRGVVQIAGFHPGYQFAGTGTGDVENATNRSPHPMLHLIREESITEVAADPEVLAGIPARNVALLRRMGWDAVRAVASPRTAAPE